MSGECDHCGDHAVDCACCMKEKYYYKGKSFDSYDGFFNYVKEWGNQALTEESSDEVLEQLNNQIKLNIFVSNAQITNRDFEVYIHQVLKYAIEKIYGYRGVKHDGG